MTPEEIRDQYRLFSQPIAFYAALGARKEAVESLARNMWAALLGGEAAEQALWQSLHNEPGLDASLLASLKACYETEMKPTITPDMLQRIREHYGLG